MLVFTLTFLFTCVIAEPVTILLGTYKGVMMITEGKLTDDPLAVLPLRATAVDYHYGRKEIFLYNNNTILRYALSPSAPSPPVTVVKTDTMATSLAVDWVNNDVFWISDQKSAVKAVSTLGGSRRDIVSHNDSDTEANWHDLVIDPYVKKLFWLSSAGVCSSDLSGSDVRCGVGSWKIQLEDLALDTRIQLLYVIGSQGNRAGDKVVARGRYDGSNPEEVLTIGQPATKVFGFGVLGQTLYWQSNHEGENLYKCNIPPAKQAAEIVLVQEFYQICYDLKLYHPDIQKPSK